MHRKQHRELGQRIALSVLLWLVCTPSLTHAELRRAPALHWTRGADAEGCIDPTSLAIRVEQLTGPVLTRPPDGLRVIEGHITHRAEGGFRARLTVADRDGTPLGERMVEHASENCRAFDAALGFVVAILIDPSLSLEALPPELLSLFTGELTAEERLTQELAPNATAAAPQSAHEEVPEPPLASAPPDADEKTRALREATYSVALLGLTEMAVMPEALYGAGLRFAWEVSHTISLVAGARSAFNIGFLELAAPAFGLGKASAFDATLAVCAGTEPEPAVRLKVCVGPEVSLWKLASLDFELSREARLTGLGAQASLELSYRLGGAFTLVAFLTARVNTLAGKFTYDDQLVAHQIPRLSLLAGAGPSYAF